MAVTELIVYKPTPLLSLVFFSVPLSPLPMPFILSGMFSNVEWMGFGGGRGQLYGAIRCGVVIVRKEKIM